MDPGETLGEDAKGSSEISEPLLKKSAHLHERETNGGQDTIIPVPSQQYFQTIAYNPGPRRCQDISFIIVFAVFVLASVAFGIFSISHHNSHYGHAQSALFDASSERCYFPSHSNGPKGIPWETLNVTKDSSMENAGTTVKVLWLEKLIHIMKYDSRQLQFQKGFLQAVKMDTFLKDMIWTLLITLILTVPFVFGILWVMRAYAKQLVYACLPFFILIPMFLNMFWFVACTTNKECSEAFNLPGRIALLIFVFLLCGIFAWIIYSNWDRVELTIRIMQTASEALLRNIRLLLVLPCLTVGLFVYFIPFVVFLTFAYMNGKIVPNPVLEDRTIACGGRTGVDCCVWKSDKWVPAYFVLAIFTVLWSALVMAEAQVYIISDTIAQWYFAPSGSHGSIKQSLWNAFVPSFGTVCFSGLVLSFVRIVRSAVDTARNNEMQQGFFFAILRCCMYWVLYAIEFLNKFIINFAAITGENFHTSAKISYDLLRRNLLSPVFVEIISTRLLAGMVFVVSVIYAIIVCAILKAATELGGSAYLVTVIAWLVLFLILTLFTQVLDNVIDTVYICYAIDKDIGAVSKPEVHDVYFLLPLSRDQPATLAIRQA